MEKLSPKTPKTKDVLLRGATKVFAQKGYAATSIRDICELTNLNVSSVSYHFHGKQGLYRSCIGRFGESLLSNSERILKTPNTSDEFFARLRIFLESMLAEFVGNPEVFILVQREIESQNPANPDIFEDTFLKVFSNLKSFIEGAQENNLYPKKANAHLLATILLSTLSHMTKTDHIAERYFGLTLSNLDYQEDIISQLMDIVEGLR